MVIACQAEMWPFVIIRENVLLVAYSQMTVLHCEMVFIFSRHYTWDFSTQQPHKWLEFDQLIRGDHHVLFYLAAAV